MSVTETLRQKIGTCIEQVALMHELLDAIGIPNQMYCCRIFEPDDYGILCEAARWKRESYHLFSGVPAGVSFREFNAFINHLA